METSEAEGPGAGALEADEVAATGGGPSYSSVVLALAYHTWADGIARQMSWSPDRVAQQLTVDPQVRWLMVANPLRSHLSRLRRRPLRFDADFPDHESRWLVQPRRWRRGDSMTHRSSVAAYRRLDGWLRERSMELGSGDTVLVTCHPVLAAVADRARWADVVYYGWDDWLADPRLEAGRDLMSWSYRSMAERDVQVIGVTDAIVERIGATRSAVVPNGIRTSDHETPVRPPSWFEALEGPVAFYAGSLEGRIDVDALEQLARDLPGWNVVLVGQLDDPPWFATLADRPNVHIRGREPRPAVLAMMAAAQVCLVPHRRTPMTEAMSPLKLFEYLASGAAVVASDLAPMRGVSDRCLMVEPGAPLAPAVLRAASLPPASAAEITEFRREHDWSARYRQWRRAALGG
jgi:glycosyltransferase involved in cell wall biosynthesis